MIGELGGKYLGLGQVWSHGIDGKMPSSVRAGILDALAHNSKRQISIAANCRCLTEGVDLPALDGVVFSDAKKSEVDIVQAIGRVIRKAPGKEIGTVIVPLVVPRDVDSSDYLERKSVLKPIAQVLRALKAHDDRFEIRMRARFAEEGKEPGEEKGSREFGAGEVEIFGLEALPVDFARRLTAKTLRIGSGLKATPLNEEGIIKASIAFEKIYGWWPTCRSEEPVPGMEGETWIAINMAGQEGLRGLVKGRTLSKILEHLKRDNTLAEEAIIKATMAFVKLHGWWPTAASKEPVPGMEGETWLAINMAGKEGKRGLVKGRTLSKIIEHLKPDNTLSEEAIIKASIAFEKLHGWWPTAESKEPVPGMEGETWRAISMAGHQGARGLVKGRTLSKIIQHLKPDNTLLEEAIIKASIAFEKLHGWWPKADSKEPVPGMEGETWRAIDAAGRKGNRGLLKGRTLSKILAPLKNQETGPATE